MNGESMELSNNKLRNMIKNVLKENKNIRSWFSLNNINDAMLNCIKNCTSPRKSKPDKSITEEDLKLIFNAFSLFNPRETRILILGQDPYPSGKATGFAFLLDKTIKQTDSLYYILKAINKEFIPKTTKKELGENVKEKYKKWIESNKVLLLNTALTHDKSDENLIRNHRKAWSPLVIQIIKNLLLYNLKLIVYLWGDFAQSLFFQVLNDNKLEDIRYEILNNKALLEKNWKVKNAYRFKKNGKVISYTKIDIPTNNAKLTIFMHYHPSKRNDSNGKKFDCNDHFKNSNTWQELLNIYCIQEK